MTVIGDTPVEGERRSGPGAVLRKISRIGSGRGGGPVEAEIAFCEGKIAEKHPLPREKSAENVVFRGKNAISLL
jgi:hypothetical protein